MQQLHLLRLFGFIGFLLAHTFMFDPSFALFATACDGLVRLHFNYLHFIAGLSWLIGMWGLLLFLNSSNNKFRLMMWAVFIVSSFINFSYFRILHFAFSSSNIDQSGEILGRLSEIDGLEWAKFIGMSIAFVVVAKYIKPLNIGFNKIFSIVLIAVLVVDMAVYSGNNLPLPSMYVIASVLAGKYLLVGLETVKSGNIAAETLKTK